MQTQSFQPHWDGGLSRLDVFIGTTWPCQPMRGQLHVRTGVPQNTWTDAMEGVLHVQPIATSCENLQVSSQCIRRHECLQWHNFTLDTSLDVVQGNVSVSNALAAYHLSSYPLLARDLGRAFGP